MKREERRYRMWYEKRETIGHMWNGCSEMRERERKERGEIRMKTEGDKIDGRDMEEEGKDKKRKEWGMGKKCVNFWNCIFTLVSG
jgi:hypothetical protein